MRLEILASSRKIRPHIPCTLPFPLALSLSLPLTLPLPLLRSRSGMLIQMPGALLLPLFYMPLFCMHSVMRQVVYRM